MCTTVIIDASVFGGIAGPEYAALHSWLDRRHGVLAYTGKGRYAEEFDRDPRMLRLLGEYRRAQLVKQVPAETVRRAEGTLDESTMQSNDPHVLALAKASDAEILCSRDRALQRDFRELLPRVGRRHRAVYPVDQRDGTRRQFQMSQTVEDA